MRLNSQSLRARGALFVFTVWASGCGTSPGTTADVRDPGDAGATTAPDSVDTAPGTDVSSAEWWGVDAYDLELVGTPLCRPNVVGVDQSIDLSIVDGAVVLLTYEDSEPADIPLVLSWSGDWRSVVRIEESPNEPRIGLRPRSLGPTWEGDLLAYGGGSLVWLDIDAGSFEVERDRRLLSVDRVRDDRWVTLNHDGDVAWFEDGAWIPVDPFQGIEDGRRVAVGEGVITLAGRLGLVASRSDAEQEWTLEPIQTTSEITSIVHSGGVRLAWDGEGRLFESRDMGPWERVPDWRTPACQTGTRLERASDGSLFIVWDHGIARYTHDGVETLVDWSTEPACEPDAGQRLFLEAAFAENESSVYLAYRESESASGACAEYILWWNSGVASWI